MIVLLSSPNVSNLSFMKETLINEDQRRGRVLYLILQQVTRFCTSAKVQVGIVFCHIFPKSGGKCKRCSSEHCNCGRGDYNVYMLPSEIRGLCGLLKFQRPVRWSCSTHRSSHDAAFTNSASSLSPRVSVPPPPSILFFHFTCPIAAQDLQ